MSDSADSLSNVLDTHKRLIETRINNKRRAKRQKRLMTILEDIAKSTYIETTK